MTDFETLWQEISTAALLGTRRKPFRLKDPNAAAGKAAALLKTDGDDEKQLLRAASVAAIYRQAGQLPAQGSPTRLIPCPEDDWPRCSQNAGDCLAIILTSGMTELLGEWIEIAAQHRQRVREEHLPALLQQQKVIRPLRRALLPVLGARGRWLAAQNPDWRTFVYYTDERIWHEGQQKERLAYFSDLRAAEPDRARELLQATWEQESWSDRAAFLQVLADGLSAADEPFLESALDDRHKDVRRAAAALLVRLPESRLVGRMTARLKQLLTWRSGLLRSGLTVRLPETCDDEIQRDGIEPKVAKGVRLDVRSWWLAQMIACVPPAVWEKAWKQAPLQIITAAGKVECEDALLWGWSEAAALHQEAVWLESLILHESRRGNHRRMLEIFPRLPPAVKERLTISLLRDESRLTFDTPAGTCLAACKHPWGRELTQAATAVICKTLEHGETQSWRWERLLRESAPYFNPELLEWAAERIQIAMNKAQSRDSAVIGLLTILNFRLKIHRAF
ncbi:MAG: hypothetical protein GX491_14875 [Chloroflexi bacterium]|nr:hypothetical protein [Chloroflexota bacterium]